MPNPTRAWHLYLNDMITFAERVIAYTESIDQVQFVADELTYHATQRNLQLIGEAATHIPNDVRARHPEVPWRLLIATRDRLMRGHRGIDDDICGALSPPMCQIRCRSCARCLRQR